MTSQLLKFTDILNEDYSLNDSQPLSLSSSDKSDIDISRLGLDGAKNRPMPCTGQQGLFRSREEIDEKYRNVFTHPYFNLVQSKMIDDVLYSDKSLVVCAPTGSGKTVIFEMAIVQLLMQIEEKNLNQDFKIIYMAPIKALCTERLTEWYPKFTKLGVHCIEVTGDTDVDFPQLKPYRIIITTPEKWDMLTRRWKDHSSLVEVVKLFLIDEVHILNDEIRGPVLEAVVSRMKTIESSAISAHRIEKLQRQYQNTEACIRIETPAPKIRFIAVSATISNPEDVANWLRTAYEPAVFYRFGDECRPVKLKLLVEGYPFTQGSSIFKFDIILNYKLWPVIQKHYNGKPTLIFCNTRKSVALTAETLSREITVGFSEEQKARLTALASTIKNKKLQALILNGVGCHHAGLLYEERINIENAFRNRDLPILITTTTLAFKQKSHQNRLIILGDIVLHIYSQTDSYVKLRGKNNGVKTNWMLTAMGVNLPAHLVIIKNTQQYINGAYQEYSISTILQMVGRAGRPQFDTEATAIIMTRLSDKARYQSLISGSEPLQSYLHKRLAENLNSEAALGTVTDVAQCVQWVNSTFLSVRAACDPRRYLGLPQSASQQLISKKIEELCVKAVNSLATSGLITMDEASCIASTDAGRLMSIYYIDVETMKTIMKIDGTESLERLLWLLCESHELSDMHLRVDERRCLNTLNRNNATATIRFPMKGKINSRQMKLNCIIQAALGCLPIPDPSLNQEATKIMRIADRVCKCLLAFVTSAKVLSQNPKCYSAVLNAVLLAKCITAHLWENSPYVSKQLKGIGPTFSSLLASAGKVSFMLLEESHPRDLERIMNKGPPAGNVIRKQVSLFPKYRLSIVPVNYQTVRIELTLLNLAYLIANIGDLTAGPNHKFYLIIGDTENNLLYFSAFKDTDLLSIYDGCITCDVTRKQNNEHKVMAHCISSNFVGIDDYCEFDFKDLSSSCTKETSKTFQEKSHKTTMKQTYLTNSLKIKKLGNNFDIVQSKEKKKRSTDLMRQYKNLKQSLEIASKNLKKSNETKDVTDTNVDKIQPSTSKHQIENSSECHFEDLVIGFEPDDHVDDDEINNILNEIEGEIINNKQPTKSTLSIQKIPKSNIDAMTTQGKSPLYSRKKMRTIKSENNYSFLDSIAKKASLDYNEDVAINTDEGFSSSIKGYVNQFIETVQHEKHNKDNKDIFVSSIIDDSINRTEIPAGINADLRSDNTDTNNDINTMVAIIPFKKQNFCSKSTNNSILNDSTHSNSKKQSDSLNDECEIVILNKDYNCLSRDQKLECSTTTSLIEQNRKNTGFQLGHFNMRSDSNTDTACDKNTGRDNIFKTYNPNESVSFHAFTNDSNSIHNLHRSTMNQKSIELQNNANSQLLRTKKLLFAPNFTSTNIDSLIEKQPTNSHCFNNYHILELEQPTHINSAVSTPEAFKNFSLNTISDSEQNGNKNYDVNSISISATKINTCSKDLRERQIHIVKSVKVDVHVTEIRFKRDNSNEKRNFNTFTTSEPQPKFETADGSPVKLHENIFAASENIYTQRSIENNEELKIFQDEFPQNTEAELQNELMDNLQYDTLTPKNLDDINDIFKKYRSKYNKSKSNSHVKLGTKSEIKIEPKKYEIPKRRYKISDLHKIKLQLPESFGELPAVIPDAKIDENTNISTINEPSYQPVQDQKPKNNVTATQYRIHEIETNTNYEVSQTSQSSNKGMLNEMCDHFSDSLPLPLDFDDNQNEFEVSQTMLNPKTLLSVSVKNEIIPPPPEFSDSPNSQTVDKQFDNTGNIHDATIFKSQHYVNIDSNAVLTEPMEIEEWTSSKEFTYTPPCSSMHSDTNSSQYVSFLSQSLYQRRYKLNQFKFTRKRYCKIKK